MTTYEKFITAEEINHLYIESSLEERMYKWMREVNIATERQYYLKIDGHGFVLDFAIFCRHGNFNVECDGDQFHTSPGDVAKDKRRDNLLQSQGWVVYRYHEKDIFDKSGFVINQVREAVNLYRGLKI